MNTNSGFKYVFWALVVVVGLSLLMLPFWAFRGIGLPCFRAPGFVGLPGYSPLVPLFLLAVLWVSVVPTLVYRDARKRGMDPWLWATVATFVPYLIGLIIYLVARSTSGTPCIDCGRRIQRDFAVCPYCRASQQTICPDCRKSVRPDWKACPYCGRALGRDEHQQDSP